MNYIVQRFDGAVACQTGGASSQVWDSVPVQHSNERWLTWDTREGAERYARMNGGTVKLFTSRGIEAA